MYQKGMFFGDSRWERGKYYVATRGAEVIDGGAVLMQGGSPRPTLSVRCDGVQGGRPGETGMGTER